MRSFVERLFQTTLVESFRSLLQVDIRHFQPMFHDMFGPRHVILSVPNHPFYPKLLSRPGGDEMRDLFSYYEVGKPECPTYGRVGEKKAHE